MRRVFELTGTLAALSFAAAAPQPAASSARPPMITRLRAALPALHHRDFALLFSGQAISVVGDALFPVALAFAVLELSGSPRASASCWPRRRCRWPPSRSSAAWSATASRASG